MRILATEEPNALQREIEPRHVKRLEHAVYVGRRDVIDLADVYSGVLVFRPVGGAFTGLHQVRVVASGSHSVVQVNVSGNSSPEMQIVIDDGAIASTAYTANDFFL